MERKKKKKADGGTKREGAARGMEFCENRMETANGPSEKRVDYTDAGHPDATQHPL